MANLIEYIQSQVYENSTEDISGSIMQQVLTRMASDEGVVNVHTISGQTPFADYNNAQAARDAVPAGFKKLGLIITYKLSSGWYVDEFIGSATSGWSTASNWKCLGPISVSQNASTGKTTITIGSESFDVATQPVSVSQNNITGNTEINIGETKYPIASFVDGNKIRALYNSIATEFKLDGIDSMQPSSGGPYSNAMFQAFGLIGTYNAIWIKCKSDNDINIGLINTTTKVVTPILTISSAQATGDWQLVYLGKEIYLDGNHEFCISNGAIYGSLASQYPLYYVTNNWSSSNSLSLAIKYVRIPNLVSEIDQMKPFIWSFIGGDGSNMGVYNSHYENKSFERIGYKGLIYGIVADIQSETDVTLSVVNYSTKVAEAIKVVPSNTLNKFGDSIIIFDEPVYLDGLHEIMVSNGLAYRSYSSKDDFYYFTNDWQSGQNLVGKIQYITPSSKTGYINKRQIKNIYSFNNRANVVFNGTLTLESGLIKADGTIESSTTFKHCSLIEIPDGVKYIIIANKKKGCPSYVNCYGSNSYDDFLGRSDNASYYQLNTLPDNLFVAMKLQDGTKYISFLTTNANGNIINLDTIIYGNDSASNGILFDDVFIEDNAGSIKIGEPNQTYHFSVKANCHLADNESNTTSLQDDENLYDDYGVIMLPSNYKKNGEPVRLIIGCHGAGGDVTVDDAQIEHSTLYQYLVANGFAVMDMNGLPQAWAQLMEISVLNNIGSPIAMECYIKGYQYVLKYFNVCQDGVIVCGGSMGGISSSNLVMSGMLPVIAHGINCPVLDTYNQIFLHPWSDGAPKIAMGVIYNLDTSGGQLVYDENKLTGYNAIVNGMQSFDITGNKVTSIGSYDFTTHKLNGADVTEYKNYPCPLKIWHCDDDNVVAPAVSYRQITAIRNAGGQAWLRRIPTGGHGPLDVGNVLVDPVGNTNYRGTTLEIKPIVEEIFMFFKRYSE